MKKVKHTPGPWALERSDWKEEAGAFSVVAGGLVLATRFPWLSRAEESDANGRLMAAAPDLLAALKEMLDKGEGCAACGFGAPGCGCRYERARTAIAKAEGES